MSGKQAVEVETVAEDVAAMKVTKTASPKNKGKRSQIFITNLTPSMDETFVRGKFGEFGNILHYFKPPVSQQDKGCCILTYSTMEASKKAKAKLNKTRLVEDGYEIDVMIQERFIEPLMFDKMASKSTPSAATPESTASSKAEASAKPEAEAKAKPVPTITAEEGSQVFLTNVNSSMTEEQVCEKFSEFGEIVHYFTPPIDQGTRKCCILTFNSTDASEKAKEKYDDQSIDETDHKVSVVVQQKFIPPAQFEKMAKETKERHEKKNIQKLAMQSAIDDLENSTCPRARQAAKILKAKSLGLDGKALAALLRDDHILIGDVLEKEGPSETLGDIAEEDGNDDDEEAKKEKEVTNASS